MQREPSVKKLCPLLPAKISNDDLSFFLYLNKIDILYNIYIINIKLCETESTSPCLLYGRIYFCKHKQRESTLHCSVVSACNTCEDCRDTNK